MTSPCQTWPDWPAVESDCAGGGRRPGPRTAPRATSDLQTSVLQPDTDRGIAALEPGHWTIVLSCGRDHAKRVYRSDSRQIFDAVRCDLAFLDERTWIPPNLPTYSLNRHDRIWFSLLTCPDRSSVLLTGPARAVLSHTSTGDSEMELSRASELDTRYLIPAECECTLLVNSAGPIFLAKEAFT